MVRPPQSFVEAAKAFIPVRVTSMAGVDLSRFTFDFDLTFAVVFAHADGTVYARYGARDADSAEGRLSMASLVATAKGAFARHQSYSKAPAPPKLKPRTIEDLPWFQRKKKPKCVHCHTVHDGEMEQARLDKRFDRERFISRYPLPDKLGIVLGVDRQTKVEEVLRSSPASRARVRKGDRLLTVSGIPVLTQADVAYLLHQAPPGATKLPLEVERKGDKLALELKLKKGWKIPTIAELRWRPTMWRLGPAPGFGGDPLSAADKRKLRIPSKRWAFRVRYIVTWGEHSYTGHAAQRGGIRKGDVVIAVDGRADFRSMAHYHTWVRMTKKPGQLIRFDILRNGKAKRLSWPLEPRRTE